MRKRSKQKNGADPAQNALATLSDVGRNQAEEALDQLPTEKRVGRPPRKEPTVQRTVSFTKEALDRLKKLSVRSGKEGFDNPDFSKTVRVAILLADSAPDDEVMKAFADELND